MGNIVKTDQAGIPALPDDVAVLVGHFTQQSKATRTKDAYRSDARIFEAWCSGRGLLPLPADPATVAGFLADQALHGDNGEPLAPSTLGRRAAAIGFLHERAGFDNPVKAKAVSDVLAGIRREYASNGGKAKQRAAATKDVIYRPLAKVDTTTLKGKRDAALLKLGFAGAFRRGELAALAVDDVKFVQEGLRVRINRSKTDQAGEGAEKAIRDKRLGIADSLKDYMAAAGVTDGALFLQASKGGGLVDKPMGGIAVWRVVKHYCELAGINPDEFGAHSLRAGFITEAAEAGAGVKAIMDVSLHRSEKTVVKYIRRADQFKNHAGESFC